MCVDKTLLNHLVGEREQRRGHIEPQRPGSLEIDDRRKLGGLLDRNITRLSALEDFVHEGGGTTKHCGEVHAVPINPPLAGHSSGPMEGKRCCAARAVIAAALA